METVKVGRAERLKEITEQLEQGIQELFESDHYKLYLDVMSKFHNYSFYNTMLIAMQKPDATYIAGFSSWKNNFKRHVKKGEKGIRILAPAPYKRRYKIEKTNPETGKVVLGEDGNPLTEEVEDIVPAFKYVTVFDISQTDGKELPTIGASELTGDVEQYVDFFKAAEQSSPVPIGFEKIESGAKGYYSQTDKRIAINDGMGQLQNLKTLIHEIVHAKLHDIDLNAPVEKQADQPDRRTREIQAESIAYAVCQHYGLDTSDYSFAYVAKWSSGQELSELKASLKTIRDTAAELIEDIDRNFAELTQNKEQTQVHEAQAEEPTPEETQPEQDAPQEDKAAMEEPAKEDAQTGQVALEIKTIYYTINEGAARRANDANSYYDYKLGSATAEYCQMVNKAVEIGEQQKKRADPMYHEKIDNLVDTYARKLAENMNNRFSIEARVPSILITGGSNFPVRKKEKQNAAREKNYSEWNDIQGFLDKIRSTGMGGISADDPQAVQKLETKLEQLQSLQDTMKAVNAYYRKHKTLDGCPNLSFENIEKLKTDMSSQWRAEDKPYPSWALSNNNAEIRRIKGRIAELIKKRETAYAGWEFDGGRVEANRENNRLQIFFEDKPDEMIRETLKSNGFRWSPKAGAWQRQLNDTAILIADRLSCVSPVSGKSPVEIQKEARAAAKPEQEPAIRGMPEKRRHGR